MNRVSAGFLTIPAIKITGFSSVSVDPLYVRLLQERRYVYRFDIPDAGITGSDDIAAIDDIP